MKKYLFLFILIFITLNISACRQNKNTDFLTINGKKIQIEIADTPESTYRGLSYRESLCVNCGMLFVFPDKKERTFVMRNMNFPLDIIWIKDNKIIKIDKDLLPEGNNPRGLYSSNEPINYVLEVNAGFTDKYNIGVGDAVDYSL